jgi:predicted phage baseplate assembly protein
MNIPLPDLDDRRWADLVDEGRALIPVYGPEWTDHNAHDPGITLMELFAWIAEMDIYQLNRIPDLHKRKFLQLVGVSPRPPQPSRGVVAFALDGLPELPLPASVELTGVDPGAIVTAFRTRRAVTIQPGRLQAVLSETNGLFVDLTDAMQRGEPLPVFGTEPGSGATLYLGFSDPFPVQTEVSLFFDSDDPGADEVERGRLIREAREARESCRPPQSSCRGKRRPPVTERDPAMPPHHSVRLEWTFLTRAGNRPEWRELIVDDTTRALTLAGSVHFTIPSAMAKGRIGRVDTPLHYVRCRIVAGAYDAPLSVARLSMNAVEVEQSIPVWTDWVIARDATIAGQPPARGSRVSFDLTLNPAGRISGLTVPSAQSDAPEWLVLDFSAPSPTADGHFVVEAVPLPSGTGAPKQIAALPQYPVDEPTFELYTVESGVWTEWTVKPDFVASRADDAHVVLDAERGTLMFGDGERGRVPPPDVLVLASYRTTRAEQGGLAAEAIDTLSDSRHNQAVVEKLADVRKRIVRVGNPGATYGGAAAETLTHAAGRAVIERDAPTRAVTADDCEWLARRTPGVKLARVHAAPNLHAGFPCVVAAGVISVVLVPSLPERRPVPTAGLRRAVASYLHRRRIIGTRIDVIGPDYLEVVVRARVRPLPGGRTSSDLRDALVAALNEFLHPVRGGPGRTGWPFGRDVYRSEVLQVIDQVPGVDHVLCLDLIAERGEPQCGNVCLGPTYLVTPGQHEIEVV